MPGPSTTFTEMVSTTLRNSATEVADNVSKNNAFLNRLKKKNKIRNLDGGTEIQVQLEYAENSTYQRYAGLDTLNTNGSDVVTSAKFDWAQVALHVVSSGKELRQNSGKFAMINLVKTKKGNALKTASNNFSVDLYSDGSLSNQIGGLANILQTNGQGTVGGIDSATWTFWRNKFLEATGTNLAATPTAANALSFKADMNRLWLSLTRGVDKPDLITFSHDFYSLYEIGEQQLQRYMDADMAQSGFIGLKYKTADVIFDDNTNFTTTAEKGYFINSDYLYVDQHKEAQWTQDDEKKPVNQDAVVIPFYWMGNLVCSNRSLQGVLFDAA
ncbi:phage major capsid protein [Mesorhizobium sp. M0309]|uniref:phage major capsid protein n=1 Tax=Mesorhizobium sp. M0309 TaxID=2956933 RepID=UPI00333C092A